MAQEKVRIYQLASQLNVPTKDLIELCQRHGIDVRNQLSTLEPELRDKVVELVRKGPSASPSSPAKPSGGQKLPVAPQKKIVDLTSKRPVAGSKATEAAPEPVLEESPAVQEPEPAILEPTVPEPLAPAAVLTEPEPEPARPPEPQPIVAAAPKVPAPVAPIVPAPVAPIVPAPVAPPITQTKVTPAEPVAPAPIPAPAPPVAPIAATPPPKPPEAPAAPTKLPEKPAAAKPTTPPPPPAPPKPVRPVLPQMGGKPMRDLGAGAPRPQVSRPPEPRRGPAPTPPRTGGSAHKMASPPQQKAKPPGDDKKAPPPSGPKKIGEISKELMDSGKPIRIEDLLKPIRPASPTPVVGVPDVDLEDDDEGKKDAKKKSGPGSGVAGRDQRHKQRQARASDRATRGDGSGKTLLLDEGDSPQVKRLKHLKRKQQQPTQPRKGKVPIELPITVRSLSEAMGLQSGKLLLQLMQHGAPATININSSLDPVLAEALALDHGCELDVKRPPDAEEELSKELEKPDDPEALVLRAPIVTIMGHVDHGKTSLLDRIRKSNIVDTEAGGITQVLRAWRVEHNGKFITFLDTPGHEAFTKMRARGANVTDIAVIVVAATDGIMPQTEEAISHAKAAEVAIIVAINKIDMPNANIPKTERQLMQLGLVPDTMGGDVQFVKTSAITGVGIDELLETISLVAEVHELKANPNKPAQGTVLEASVSEDRGVLATLLVRDGTLRRGDFVLCGPAYGRIRALSDDMGRPIEEAGPSVPCRITGLDEIPNADDPFAVVEDLMVAREIAEKRKAKIQEASLHSRAAVDLGSLLQTKAIELKVVLKADVRGSVEAIRKELEKLQHDEVKVRILHFGIGAINESDVSLALISPHDTLVIGFNVVADDAAQTLADARGVQIREYNIIYKLTDDIRAALEGKLKPREEIVHLGRAVVRETFKISRVGTIAGCRVTQGTMERSAKVRVIRNGVVIFPPADRVAGFDSLKRFKEDAKEVPQGYECGLKISGYDDVKVDDVIECYRIEQVLRTLS